MSDPTTTRPMAHTLAAPPRRPQAPAPDPVVIALEVLGLGSLPCSRRALHECLALDPEGDLSSWTWEQSRAYAFIRSRLPQQQPKALPATAP